jgi:hypothetical protein
MDSKRLKGIIILLGDTSHHEEQGNYFLKKTNTTFVATYSHVTNTFIKGLVNTVYEITLKNENGVYQFDFTQSVHNSKLDIKPTPYDVLSGVTCYEVEKELKDFCSEFGYEHKFYNEDLNRYCLVKESQSIHNACKKEYRNIKRMFKNTLDILCEIN